MGKGDQRSRKEKLPAVLTVNPASYKDHFEEKRGLN